MNNTPEGMHADTPMAEAFANTKLAEESITGKVCKEQKEVTDRMETAISMKFVETIDAFTATNKAIQELSSDPANVGLIRDKQTEFVEGLVATVPEADLVLLGKILTRKTIYTVISITLSAMKKPDAPRIIS